MRAVDRASEQVWKNPYTRPLCFNPNHFEIIEWHGEPNEYGAQRATVKCPGEPGSCGGCIGTYKDVTGDGHGGLNGGAYVSCSRCAGTGVFRLWMKKV